MMSKFLTIVFLSIVFFSINYLRLLATSKSHLLPNNFFINIHEKSFLEVLRPLFPPNNMLKVTNTEGYYNIHY